jgi:hypothetical protein
MKSNNNRNWANRKNWSYDRKDSWYLLTLTDGCEDFSGLSRHETLRIDSVTTGFKQGYISTLQLKAL